MSPKGWVVAVLLAVVGLSLTITWGLRIREIREIESDRWIEEAPAAVADDDVAEEEFPLESADDIEIPTTVPASPLDYTTSVEADLIAPRARRSPLDPAALVSSPEAMDVAEADSMVEFSPPHIAFTAISPPNRLTVLSADGVGLYGASVALLASPEAASAIWQGLTDEEGEVDFDEAGDLPSEAAVIVSAPGHMAHGPALLTSLGGESAIRLTRASSLEGRVLGPMGQPLTGARVSVQYAGEAVAAQRIEQLTDARGGFRFDDLPVGHALVRAEAPDLLGHERWVAIPASGHLRISLSHNGALAGRVLDQGSRPISGATVTVHSRAWGLSDDGLSTPTTPDGEFAFDGLEPGTFRIWAEHPGYDEGPASDTTLTLHSDLTTVDLILEQPQTTISGRVFDVTSGVPIGGFAVCAEPWVAGTFFDTWSANRPSAVTDHLGRFTLALDAGRWRLAEATALNEGHLHRALTSVQPVEFSISASGRSRSALTLMAAAAIVLEGEVIDPDGNPLPGASVHAEAEGLGASSPVLTDAAGRFRLDRSPLGRSPDEAVNLRLIARHSAWPAVASPQVALHPGDRLEELSLQLGIGHPVEGVLTDGQSGLPVEGASVSLQDSLTGELLRSVSNLEGRFLFAARPAQPHLLTIVSADHSTHRKVISPSEDLGVLDITMTSGLAITGRVVDLSGDPVIGVEIAAPLAGRSVFTQPDGRFVLGHLEPVAHDITFTEVEPPHRVASRRGVLPGGDAMEVVIGWEDAVVTGTVTDDVTELPQPFFTMVINHFDGESDAHLSTRVEYFESNEGEFEVTLFRPGRHHFAIVAANAPIAEEEFVVSQGGQRFDDVEITVPRPNPHLSLGSIAGKIELGDGIDSVFVESAGLSGPVESDGVGAFALAEMAPGTHTLIVHGDGDDGVRLLGYYPNVVVALEETTELGDIARDALTPPAEPE